MFYVIVACNDGQERYLMYLTGEGTDSKDCRYLRFYLGSNLTDNAWKSIERDVRADLARFEPGLSVTAINAFALRAGDLYLDDLRLRPAGDEAFQYASRLDGTLNTSEWVNPSYVSSLYDAGRRSDVIKIAGGHWVMHGKDYRGGGASWDYNVSGMRTLSVWAKSSGAPEFIVTVQTGAGLRPLRYVWNGTPTTAPYAWTGGSPNVPLFGCEALGDGRGNALEKNPQAALRSFQG